MTFLISTGYNLDSISFLIQNFQDGACLDFATAWQYSRPYCKIISFCRD
jgi:hypothetical protein